MRTASALEIHAAYKKLAMKHHPDRHSAATEAEQAKHAEHFKTINDAASVLTDTEKRQTYDQFGLDVVSDSSASGSMDDVWEAMFMGGGRGVSPKNDVGGALFVDPCSGQFFQRSWEAEDIEKMRNEMQQGLPEVFHNGDVAASYVTSTPLPHGTWDVRLVEVDAEVRTTTVTLYAEGFKKVDSQTPPLRVERIFSLPAEADVDAVDVTIDEAGVLLLTTPRKGALPRKAIGVSANLPMSDATTIERTNSPAPNASASVDESEPMFMIGEDTTGTATAEARKPNRTARRRAKHDGLKAGFFNAKPKAARKENVQPEAKLSPPPVDHQHACMSPVSVRDGIDAAMHAQVGALQGV